LAKIAVEVERALATRAINGCAGSATPRLLGRGAGWVVEDVVCNCGPHDNPFEEQHQSASIAFVVAGTFQYRGDTRSGSRAELMTPGAVMLGNPGQYFECEHAHGAGDRCVSFRFTRERFEGIARDLGLRASAFPFSVPRLPPLRETASLIGLSCAGLLRPIATSWEELSLAVAARIVQIASGVPARTAEATADAIARVTQVVRTIERHADADLTLDALARRAELSPYHFLRTFERVTGATPHQYLLRARLREAAARLVSDPAKVLDVALDCGFGDVSNFNRAFRMEFGVAPRAFRRAHLHG
jgi:AraC family transcriptional regulator